MIEILNRIPISAKVITVGCDDLKDSVVNGEEGDIEGAATKIENEDILLLLVNYWHLLGKLDLISHPKSAFLF